jgi:hypothetical protein
VHLEWDRGHEGFDAAIRSDTEHGLIVTEFLDLVLRTGMKWIRRAEVVELEDLPATSAQARLMALRSVGIEPVDDRLTELPKLIEHLAGCGDLVAVFRTATGSDALLVGRIERTSSRHFDLALVDEDGATEPDHRTYVFDEVISVEWGTDYLNALQDLNLHDG